MPILEACVRKPVFVRDRRGDKHWTSEIFREMGRKTVRGDDGVDGVYRGCEAAKIAWYMHDFREVGARRISLENEYLGIEADPSSTPQNSRQRGRA